jgi:DNA-binding transcriptional LysR family regulator
VTLAEELHFGRTAERLQLTSSRISQTLRDLERKLGGRLVSRSTRRVALTPLGVRFLADVGPVVEQLSDVLERTHAANRTLEGTLRVGLLAANSGGPRLTEIIEAFERSNPACEVIVSEVFFTDPLGPLQRGEIDVMATRLPINQPGITVGRRSCASRWSSPSRPTIRWPAATRCRSRTSPTTRWRRSPTRPGS